MKDCSPPASSSLAGIAAGTPPAVPKAIQTATSPAGEKEHEHRCTALTHMDVQRTIETWIENSQRVRKGFAAFASSLEPRLQTMERDRPDIMAKPFDTIFENGRLKVVDTSMPIEELAWVENQLNGPDDLSHLAESFLGAVVTTYETNRGAWRDDGTFELSRSFRDESGATISYQGLQATVGKTVKLMSLFREAQSATLPKWLDETHRYDQGGWMVQKYLVGEITTYSRGSNGQMEANHQPGSILGDGIWI